MKILILATPRSGSSAFQTAVSQAHDLEWFSEPFNFELQSNWDGNKSREHLYPYRTEPFNVPDGFVIKALTFFNHWPDKFAKEWEKGGEHYLRVYFSNEYQRERYAFFDRYVRCFDRVFLLLRRDVGAQLRSMLIGLQKDRREGGRQSETWWGGYEAFDPVLDRDGQLNTRFLFESIRIIERISSKHKIPILCYEDLFAPKDRFDRVNEHFKLGLEGMWEPHFDPGKKWGK